MKLGTAVIASLLFCAPAAIAQAPAANAQTKPAPQHQPGVSAGPPAAQSSSAPSQTSTADSSKPPSLAAKSDPEKEAAIRQLLDLTEGAKLGDAISAMITNSVHTGMSRALPPDQLTAFMDTFSQKFSASVPPQAVTDAIVPIYAAHLSTEDVKALIQFFQSPVGQHELKAMPVIVQEAQRAGGEIEQKAALEILKGMSDTYPQLKQMLQPDPNAPPPSGAPGAPNSPSGAPAPAPRLAPAPAPAPSAPQK